MICILKKVCLADSTEIQTVRLIGTVRLIEQHHRLRSYGTFNRDLLKTQLTVRLIEQYA